MTFLSVSPEAFPVDLPARAAPRRALQGSMVAQSAAALIFVVALTIPGAVAQAKWRKLGLVATFVQHRCVAAFSA